MYCKSAENLAASEKDAFRIRDALLKKFPDRGRRSKAKERRIVIAKGLTAREVVETAIAAAHDVDACLNSVSGSRPARLAAG